MAIPKSEASGRAPRRPSTTQAPKAPSNKASSAKDPKSSVDTKSSVDAKKRAAEDAARDEAKSKAWEAAKKEAAYARQAAVAHRVPRIKGDAEDRPPASKPSSKATAANAKPSSTASAGQRNRSESMAEGVAQKRSNPLPTPAPSPKPSNTAAAGQRNRSESMAEGVAQKRSNPLPTPEPGLHNPIAPYIARGASPTRGAVPPTGVTSPLDPFIKGASNSPAMAPTPSPRPSPSMSAHQTGGPAAGGPTTASEKGVADRLADLWEIGEARRNGVVDGFATAAIGAANWLWETGTGVAKGVTSGEYKDAAIREYQAANQEFIKSPVLASQQAKMDLVGGLGSVAWDAGQGMVWIGAQAVATVAEVAKLAPRINNAVSYLATGEYVVDLGPGTAWGQANQIVSDYGGEWKRGIQKFSAEQLGMRTGQGGTEKSIFFRGGEVGGTIASFVAPPMAAGKAGMFGRAAAASGMADDAARVGAGIARTGTAGSTVRLGINVADDAATATGRTAGGAATNVRVTAIGSPTSEAAAATRTGAASIHFTGAPATSVQTVPTAVSLSNRVVGLADDVVELAGQGAARAKDAGGGWIQRVREGYAHFNDKLDRIVQGDNWRIKAADELRTALNPPPPGSTAQKFAEEAKEMVKRTLSWVPGPDDIPGMQAVEASIEHVAQGAGRRWLSGPIREYRLSKTLKNDLAEKVQAERARALAAMPSPGAPPSLLRRAEATLDDWTTKLNAKTAEIQKPRLEALEKKSAARQAKAEAKQARAAAARNGDLGPVRQLFASAQDAIRAPVEIVYRQIRTSAEIVYQEMPRTAKILLEAGTRPASRRIDKSLAFAKDRAARIAEAATNFARRHPVLNEIRLVSRELFRQANQHHTLRDEIGRGVKLFFNEPWAQGARKGAQVALDFSGAIFNLGSTVLAPVTNPIFGAVGKGLKVSGKTSWIAAKSVPPYLAFEGWRGNVEFRNDPSALRRANLSTDPEHAMGVNAYTVGTTSKALLQASLSLFHSGPTVKGINPMALVRGEWSKVFEVDQAVPSAFVRSGPDGAPQLAWNTTYRGSMGILGGAWKLGPDVLNVNGNAHAAFATLGGATRWEMGNINEKQGFNAGFRAYAALGVLVRYSMESNLDYPPLNIPGGFTDGRLVYDANRPVLFKEYWFGGGHHAFADVQLTGSASPLGLSGVVKKTEGELMPSAYLGRTLVPEGGALRVSLRPLQDRSFYANVFGRNPEALKATEALKAASAFLYSLPGPFGGKLFKQVEQYGAEGGAALGGGGGSSWGARTQADRVEDTLERAERTPGPTAPWQGPARTPRTQEQRVEDRIREAERVRGPSPPARQLDLEPAPVFNPGIAGQFVVLPRDGVNLRAAPGLGAQEITAIRHGEPLLQTGPAQPDADNIMWIPVVGRDAANRETVAGFVREDLVVSHPAGDKDAKGRIDTDLRRQGYTAVEVALGDTVRNICLRRGLTEEEIRKVIVLNRDHQIANPDLIYPGDTVYLPER